MRIEWTALNEVANAPLKQLLFIGGWRTLESIVSAMFRCHPLSSAGSPDRRIASMALGDVPVGLQDFPMVNSMSHGPMMFAAGDVDLPSPPPLPWR